MALSLVLVALHGGTGSLPPHLRRLSVSFLLLAFSLPYYFPLVIRFLCLGVVARRVPHSHLARAHTTSFVAFLTPLDSSCLEGLLTPLNSMRRQKVANAAITVDAQSSGGKEHMDRQLGD
jgi:hypothetical protein